MSRANAALIPWHRLQAVQLVIEKGRPISEIAASLQVSWSTTTPSSA